MGAAKIARFYSIGDPMLLTLHQFNGYLERIPDIVAQESGGRDHRAHVERETRRKKGGRYG